MDTNVRAIYLDIGGRRAGGRGSGRTRRSRRRRWHSLHVSSIVSHPLPSPPSADTHTHQRASVKPKKPTPLYTARQNRPSMPVFPPYPATDKAYVCVCVPVLCSCRRRCRRRCARVQIQYYSALPPHVVCAREQHTHAHAHTYTLYQKTKASSSGLVGARRSDGSGDGGGALAHVARKSITERSPHALSESAAKTRIRVHTFLYHVHAFRRRRRRCPPSRWYVENPAPSPPPPPTPTTPPVRRQRRRLQNGKCYSHSPLRSAPHLGAPWPYAECRATHIPAFRATTFSVRLFLYPAAVAAATCATTKSWCVQPKPSAIRKHITQPTPPVCALRFESLRFELPRLASPRLAASLPPPKTRLAFLPFCRHSTLGVRVCVQLSLAHIAQSFGDQSHTHTQTLGKLDFSASPQRVRTPKTARPPPPPLLPSQQQRWQQCGNDSVGRARRHGPIMADGNPHTNTFTLSARAPARS